jgi:hypothetical protein
MLTCNLQGGLGNQLFQIFTTIALSLRTSQPFFFINKHQLTSDAAVANGTTIRYSYWDTFMSNLKQFTKDQSVLPKLDLYLKEQAFTYDPSILTNVLNNLQKVNMLVGYFQSSKYFDTYKDKIFQLLKISNKQLVIKVLYENLINFDNTISMHFRLGDYKKYPEVYPILTTEYYINSVNYILSQKSTATSVRNILYFCEDDDFNDVLQIIIQLQHIYTDLTFERADNKLLDWQQMLLMSLCKDNIIANSTFSWWAAYFNSNINKNVCYPATWFKMTAGHNTRDLCPDDWTAIDCGDGL